MEPDTEPEAEPGTERDDDLAGREIALDQALRLHLSVGLGGPRPTADQVITTAELFHKFLTNTNEEKK